MKARPLGSDAAPSAVKGSAADVSLIWALGEALDAAGVRYCQWKGHQKRWRWTAGLGDIDLLVDPASARTFTSVLDALHFKLALPACDRSVPGVVSYLGLDPSLGRLIHIHTHYQLVVGPTWGRHYRLPFARELLDTVVPATPFAVPAPRYDAVLSVLRLTLRHSHRDLFHRGEPPWLREGRSDLQRLEGLVSASAVVDAVTRALPEMDAALFRECHRSLVFRYSAWRRISVRNALEHHLRAYRRRPPVGALRRRATAVVERRFARLPSRGGGTKRLVTGGAIIALVGSDGSGKSTCARALRHWLAGELRTRHAHLGRPPRSLLTLTVGAVVKAMAWTAGRGQRERWHGHLSLVRSLCAARDRYRLYRAVRHAAHDGSIVICERFPIAENSALVGASRRQGRLLFDTRLARAIRRREERYYELMTRPDRVFVLHVDPDTAAHRKLDEPEDYVRCRAQRMSEVHWSHRDTTVIDASVPLEQVLAGLRVGVWEAL